MPRRRIRPAQLILPIGKDFQRDSKRGGAAKPRIAHLEILTRLQPAFGHAGRGLTEIYRTEVLPVKTRTIRLLGRKTPAQIIHTLLGFEVKASIKRIHCPDMVTARYLKLFTELGCRSIRLPYDPTITARLLPELEASTERLTFGVRQLFPRRREVQLYVIRRLYSYIRRQVQAC